MDPLVEKLTTYLIVFVGGELVALPVFALIRRWLAPDREKSETNPKGAQAAKRRGTLERLLLYTGLLAGYPQVLIMFGALKVATRLKDENGDPNMNRYFLTGNFASVLLVLLTVVVAKSDILSRLLWS